jgi:hypothetical protein
MILARPQGALTLYDGALHGERLIRAPLTTELRKISR